MYDIYLYKTNSLHIATRGDLKLLGYDIIPVPVFKTTI